MSAFAPTPTPRAALAEAPAYRPAKALPEGLSEDARTVQIITFRPVTPSDRPIFVILPSYLVLAPFLTRSNTHDRRWLDPRIRPTLPLPVQVNVPAIRRASWLRTCSAAKAPVTAMAATYANAFDILKARCKGLFPIVLAIGRVRLPELNIPVAEWWYPYANATPSGSQAFLLRVNGCRSIQTVGHTANQTRGWPKPRAIYRGSFWALRH